MIWNRKKKVEALETAMEKIGKRHTLGDELDATFENLELFPASYRESFINGYNRLKKDCPEIWTGSDLPDSAYYDNRDFWEDVFCMGNLETLVSKYPEHVEELKEVFESDVSKIDSMYWACHWWKNGHGEEKPPFEKLMAGTLWSKAK